ncbi:hypothetical protein BDR06DRAFT_350742 [Suillus hirtellus]|nr:hypothetical protein BDR06DRAFT_350742 [Suillus hirtellus]
MQLRHYLAGSQSVTNLGSRPLTDPPPTDAQRNHIQQEPVSYANFESQQPDETLCEDSMPPHRQLPL